MTKNTKKAVKPVVYFVADGEVKEFFYNFLTFDEDDIDVYVGDELQNTNYSVICNEESGGSVVFNEPPEAEKIVTIIRNLEIKRTSDFQESGAFRAKVINHELDYQVASLQQLDEKIGRTLLMPPYLANQMNGYLPMPQAGKAIVWNQSGNALVNSDLAIDTSFQNISSYVEDAKNSAEEAKKQAIITAENTLASQNWAEKAQLCLNQYYVPSIFFYASDCEDNVYNINWNKSEDLYIYLDSDLTLFFKYDYPDFIFSPQNVLSKTYLKRIIVEVGSKECTLTFNSNNFLYRILNGCVPDFTPGGYYEILLSLVPCEASFFANLEMIGQVFISIGKYYR